MGEQNTKIDLTEECEDRLWIKLAQACVQWRILLLAD
jgi:hypothetical protein